MKGKQGRGQREGEMMIQLRGMLHKRFAECQFIIKGGIDWLEGEVWNTMTWDVSWREGCKGEEG